ncbi:MAG: alcohol acetyltransferase, partial [Clostridia bacterium]|nr:alcohol acetyltransferase [Clostridia bacterium]
MRKNSFDWFRLDNAAKIFPGQNSNTWSNIYRLSARLTEEVDKNTLQTALETTLRRIPSFNVRIRKGFFWHYFERNPNIPQVLPDIKNPCYRIKFRENDGFLFRVYYRGRNISVDVYHALCDGYGAAVFLSTLTGEYLRLKGKKVQYNDFVLDVTEKPKKEELEDAYLKYASSKVKYNRRDKFVYHAVGTKVPKHMN